MDNSRHAAYLVPEASFGVTPDNPAWEYIRHSGFSLGLTKNMNISEELRADRQIVSARHGNKQVGGDISTVFSYGSFDKLLAAALCGSWASKAVKTGTTLSAAAADSSFSDSGNGLVIAGFEVGDIFTAAGFATEANNGTFKVATVAAGKITVTDTDGEAVVLVDEAAGASVTLTSTADVLKAGTDEASFSVLRHFEDAPAGVKGFHLINGVVINNFALKTVQGGNVTATFTAIGKGLAISATAPDGSTYGDPLYTEPMVGFVGTLTEGGSAFGYATEIDLSLENGMETRFVYGSAETIKPSRGRSTLTGQLVAYFEDTVMLEKFVNETPSALLFDMTDPDGNRYAFSVPLLKYTGGQPDVSGQGSITLTLPFQALRDATLESQISVTRYPAAA